MSLAAMVAVDRSALICDLAETYGVLDYEALPVPLLATLSVGLRENSRIKMKLSGERISADMQLMAAAVDNLAFLCWAQTKDGARGRNRPKSVLVAMLGQQKTDSEVLSFNSGEEFEAAREEILRRIQDGD